MRTMMTHRLTRSHWRRRGSQPTPRNAVADGSGLNENVLFFAVVELPAIHAMAILRTFIGVRIAPPPPLRALLTRLGAVVGRVTPIDPDKLHVTLKFLGDTRTKLLPKIHAVL